MFYKKLLITWIAALLLSFNLTLEAQEVEISSEELQEYVTFLASDSLKGRYPGTEESKVAATYIRDHFEEAGLTLLGDYGFQYFNIPTDVKVGTGNYLEIDYQEYKPGVDYTPFAFSENGSFRGKAVFCGYGFDIQEDSLQWNNYQYTDVGGKWVIILRGYPGFGEKNNPLENYGSDRQKVLTAKDKGASGVLLVTPPEMNSEDMLDEIVFDKTTSSAGIPVLQLRREVVDGILKPVEMSVAKVEEIAGKYKVPTTLNISTIIDGRSDVEFITFETRNVVALLEGNDPDLKEEYIVLGAHFDHLGMGGPESGSRAIDTLAIHNGADDNASGVAGIMALAEKLAAHRAEIKRSILFVAFGAEEMGLKGSKHFIKEPLVDVKSIKAMVNFDMIGRLKDDGSVMIGGTGTSKESEKILTKLNEDGYNLNLGFSPDGYGPSDHAAFYSENIPVFFVSTGAHTDYHTPNDDADRLNYEGEKKVLDFSYDLILTLANRKKDLTFTEAGPKTRESSGYQFKVTLGIMPDFTGGDDSGLRVDGVRTDGPADKGGMKKGDVIVAMNGMTVTNIYDYMNRLKRLSAGERVAVDVMRDGEKIVLLIQL